MGQTGKKDLLIMKTVKIPALDMCSERQQTPCNFVEVFRGLLSNIQNINYGERLKRSFVLIINGDISRLLIRLAFRFLCVICVNDKTVCGVVTCVNCKYGAAQRTY